MNTTNETHTFLGEYHFPSDMLTDFLTFCLEHEITITGIQRMTPIGYDYNGVYRVAVDLHFDNSDKDLVKAISNWIYGCDMKEKYKDKFSEEELEKIFGY